ncbi:YopX family protein [Paenilisteria newyorkensis]|uniref:YopX family protein n=1 Tax=Listeria newyorkensis TaxID=1497681 RepID=UPI0007411992|nr:YopX family protein [Listeria newyorkensis]
MSRLIEFRGKRLDNGEWACGSYVEAYGHWIEEFATWGPRMHGNEIVVDAGEHYAKYEIDPKTRGQYTGLKDKNGNKIFERDILRKPAETDWEKESYISYECWYDERVGRYLGWRVANAVFHGNLCGGLGEVSLENVHKYEIIGNIYDNPELTRKGRVK